MQGEIEGYFTTIFSFFSHSPPLSIYHNVQPNALVLEAYHTAQCFVARQA